MNPSSLQDLLHLGGHGLYVWGAYASTLGALALVGAVNIPLIYFSVRWWNTLHQGATLTPQGARMATPMLVALLLMTLAFWAYTFAVVFTRARAIVLEQQSDDP